MLWHRLDRRDADELPGYRALAEQDQRRRSLELDPGEGVVDIAVERREALVRIAGDDEPDGAHGALRGRDPLDRERGRAIRRDGHACENAGENGCRHGEPEHRHGRPAVGRRRRFHASPATNDADLTRRPPPLRYAAVFVRFPQIDMEHHVDEAFRDAS